MREIDTELPAHDLVVVEVADGGGGGLLVRVFGETEALWTSSFAIVDEAEGEDAAGGGEDFGYLLFS